MAQILRLNSTDERITYDNNWKIISNSGAGQNGTYSLASTPTAQFFFLFRGTSIRFYGRLGGGGGSLQFRLDGINSNVPLNGTNFDNGPTIIYSADNLGDGDHQLFVYIISLQQNGTVAVDYFEVGNQFGQGFDLLWAGPNATNVPKEAIIVDNTSPDIVYSDASQWGNPDNVQFYRRSLSNTNAAGASLSYSFYGVALWFYCAVDIPHGFFTISIDGSTPQRVNGKKKEGQLAQQMLWSKTDLSPGKHIFTLTQDDVDGAYIDLDFFRILRGGATSSSASISTSTPISTSTDVTAPKLNTVPLAVGLTLGFLALLGVILGTFWLQRRRRRRPVDPSNAETAHVHPFPATQVHQRSRWPRESKHTPQRTLSPPRRSTLPSGVSATATFTSPITTELELPPSYESHLGTGSVATG